MSQVITDFGVRQILEEFGIEDINNGASTGGRWFNTRGEQITSFSPVDGETIAKVDSATEADYEAIILKAQEAFEEWRTWPAPKRGEVIRQLAKKFVNTKHNLEHSFPTKWGNHYKKVWEKSKK